MDNKKNKTISWALCFCFVVMAIGGLSLLSERGLMESTEAADTGGSPLIGMEIKELIDLDLRGVAWNDIGTLAVVVGSLQGTNDGVAYSYNARTGNWQELNFGGGLPPLHGVSWHGGNNEFVMVGDSTGGGDLPSVYKTDGIMTIQTHGIGQLNKPYYDVAATDGAHFLLVGDGIATIYDGAVFNDIVGLDETYTYTGATYTDSMFYFVGGHEFNGRLYEVNLVGELQSISPPDYYELLGEQDIWTNPLYGIEARGDDILIVGGDNLIEVYDSDSGDYMGGPVEGIQEWVEFRDAAWIPGSASAYVVGYTEDGVIYQYRHDDHRASEVPGSEGVTGRQYSVAGRVISPPMFISVGEPSSDSAWQISQTSGFHDIIVNTYFPHINNVDMYEVGFPDDSVLNKQIDVNADGQEDRVYEISIDVSHELGGLLDTVELRAWYNDGVAGDYPLDQDPTDRTTAFRVIWYRDTGEFTWLWPTEEEGQMEIVPGIHSSIDNSGVDNDAFVVNFRFIPGPQMRFANGEGGSFHENLNPYIKEDALRTMNTWNFMVEARDTHEGHNRSYDEFGVYRFTSLTVEGLPGSYSASGAPGMNDVLLIPGGETFVTYSANCAHSLKVYLETDLIGIDTAEVIPASNMHVQGGELEKIQFVGPGVDNAQYLIGNGDLNTPRNMYNYTTTAVNTLNEEDTDYPEIQWWVDIPAGRPEDSYRTNLIYVLEHDG